MRDGLLHTEAGTMNNFNQEPDGWPECEEFYNLMQAYRHVNQHGVYLGEAETIKQYEAVKAWLRKERNAPA